MKCAIIQIHTDSYQPLVDLNAANMKEYCAKHGYDHIVKIVKEHSWDMGFRRLEMVLERTVDRSFFDVLWVLGVDTIIMNHHILIENRMDPRADFIIAKDCNDINADSFLIRNTIWANKFLKEVLSTEEEFMKTQFVEQAAIADAIEKPHNAGHVKIVPQRQINSYLYADGLNPEWKNWYLDHPGKYGRGDWIIHLPGLPLKTRIETVKKYLPLVVK